MKLCYVTGRKALPGTAPEQLRSLLSKIQSAAHAGVDWIQIREKDLSARELMDLVTEAIRRAPAPCRILVNDRLDIACAAGAGGVHLGEQSLPVAEVRRFAKERKLREGFLLGASAHSLQAALAAEQDGADYVIFGPVFETPSKAAFGPPQGVERLAEVCRNVSIPVLAIGGITGENAHECMTAGAEGIAAIRLFQAFGDISIATRSLRA